MSDLHLAAIIIIIDIGKQKHKQHLQIIEHWRVHEYWFKPFYSQIHLQQPVLNQSSHLRDEQLFEEKTSKTFFILGINQKNRKCGFNSY